MLNFSEWANRLVRWTHVFAAISNHFPTATYGNHYAVPILGGLILIGWGAAALIRRA